MLFNVLKEFGVKEKIENINGIKLTRFQIDSLNFYGVDINAKNVKELLKRIADEMLYHVDERGIPNDEHYDLLADLYDDIERQNR